MRGSIYRRLVYLFAAIVGGGASWAAIADIAIKDVRVWAGHDATRVVFDLSGPAQRSVMTLSDPERVVVDISSATATELSESLPKEQGFIKRIRVGDQGNGDLRVVI